MALTEQEQLQANTERAAAKPRVELHAALERLHKNKDFKAVIEQGYLVQYAAQQVGLLADPGANKQVVHEGLQGIAELLAYFRTVEHHGRVAAKLLGELDELENAE